MDARGKFGEHEGCVTPVTCFQLEWLKLSINVCSFQDEMTPLHHAAQGGHETIVSYFLEKFKADPSARSRVSKFGDKDTGDNSEVMEVLTMRTLLQCQNLP